MATNVIFVSQPNSGENDAYERRKISQTHTLLDATQSTMFDCQKIWDAVIWDQASDENPAGDPGGSPSVAPFILGANVVGANLSSIGVPTTGVDINTRMVPIILKNTYSASRAIVQSKEYYLFEAGKGSFISYSGIFSPRLAPQTQEIKIVLRSSTSGSANDLSFDQSVWNLDRLDNSGPSTNPSGVTLNIQNMQTLVIDAQMYAGRIRFGFRIGGAIIFVHEFLTANVSILPSTQNYNLPVRYEISNQSNRAVSRCGYFDSKNGVFLEVSDDFDAGSATIHMKDVSVVSEGIGIVGFYQNVAERFSSVVIPDNGMYTPLISVRPKIFVNGIENRARLFPVGHEAFNSGNGAILFSFFRSGVVDGGSPTNWVDAGGTKTYEINNVITSLDGGHSSSGTAAPPGSGASQTLGTIGQIDHRTPNVMSKVDRTITNQKAITLVARPVDGQSSSCDGCLMNIGETYN